VQRSVGWLVAFATAGIVSGASMIAVGIRGGMHRAVPALVLSGSYGDPVPPRVDPVAAGRTEEQLAALERARRVRALDAALKDYAETVPEFSVAVVDRRTGRRYSFRGGERYESASVVKVQVLACLLLTGQAGDDGPADSEVALATRMIGVSDNDATTALFDRLGGRRGIDACNRRLGLIHTTVDDAWGLTTTTVDDQVTLLSALVDPKGPLNATSRRLAFRLMSTVDDDQDWGVPAVARPGETTTVKNGWLPRSTENDNWIVNTVGRITGDGTDVSIAVLSHGHARMSSGIGVVERAAKLTRQYLGY
jgi:beta-lactamase class A